MSAPEAPIAPFDIRLGEDRPLGRSTLVMTSKAGALRQLVWADAMQVSDKGLI